MKISLSSGALPLSFLFKNLSIFLFIWISFGPVSAQKKYPTSQSSGTTFGCLLCSIARADNSINADHTDFTRLNIPVGNSIGSLYQILSWPQVNRAIDSLVIVLGKFSPGITPGNLYVETLTDGTPNGDRASVAVLGFDEDDNNQTIRVKLKPGTSFNRVQITLEAVSGGLTITDVYYAYAGQDNQAPEAVNDTVNVVKNTPTTGNVLTNDTDLEGNALTASLVTAPVEGTVVLNADGSFTYTPNTDFTGTDSLIYQTCDNGIPSRCDTASLYFNVTPLVPVITSVSVPTNGYYKSGDVLNFTVNFSEIITVSTTGGTPSLNLMIGSTGRRALYISGSGSNALTFSYTVVAEDIDLDGITVNSTAIALNGGTIQNSISNNAILTLNRIGDTSGIFVYSNAPSVTLSTTAASPGNGPFTVSAAFSESVTGLASGDFAVINATVGSPQTTDNITYTLLVTPIAEGAVSVQIPAGAVVNIANTPNASSNTLNFTYDQTPPNTDIVSGPLLVTNSSTATFTFSSTEPNSTYEISLDRGIYTLASNPTTFSGFGPGLHTLDVKAADQAGNIDPTPATYNWTIDRSSPVVTSVDVPANGYYTSGNALNFTVHFNENAIVNTTGGTPYLDVIIGTTTHHANYANGSGTNAFTFRYTVQVGEMDMDGIALGTALVLNDANIRDAADNDAILTLNNIGSTLTVFVNTANPGVALSATAASPGNRPFTLKAIFTEPVTGFTLSDMVVTNASLSNLQTTDNITYTALVTPTTDGTVSVQVPADVAVNIGNNANSASNKLNFTYDATVPSAPVVLTVADGETIRVNTALISGTAEEDEVITVYIDAAVVSSSVTVDGSGNWSYTSGTLSDGPHAIFATAKDEAGNISVKSNTNNFTVKTGPEISTAGNLAALGTTYGTASSTTQFRVSGVNMTAGILITPPDGYEVSADNNSFNNTVTVGSSGTISGTVSIRLKSTAAAGSYSGNVVLSSTGATNRNLPTVASTVNKAALLITAKDTEKFAGTANPELTASYSGFVNRETAAVLTTPPTISTTAFVDSPVGDYPISASGAAAANYSISYKTGTLKIKAGAPTNLNLAGATLYENSIAGTNAGILSSTSDDPSATFTYTLVSGTGDGDNSLFSISGNKLNTAGPLNYENKSVYQVRVRSTTQNSLWLEKELSISVSDVNEAPTLNAITNQAICYTSAEQTVALMGISAGPETGQLTTLSVTSSNAGLFESLNISGNGATGSVKYRLKNTTGGTATVTITIKDDGGAANGGTDLYSRSFVVTVNALPVLAIASNQGSTISKGESIQLTATGAASYQWKANGSILNGLNSAFISVRPMETTTYTVTGTNAGGCTQTQDFTLTVLDDFAKLKANNILTPNNDGYNDKWVVENIDVYPDNEVKVFDKAGRVVYTKKGYDNSWDGTMNGAALNEDTYYYILDFGISRPKFKGYITLIREN